MAKNESLLVLRLEGVLQSWGEAAKWDDRDSASMPSKSGIVGLLACAMGLERDSSEIAALSDAITVSVRADRPGMKTVDFQTVTGDPLWTAEGKKRSNGTFISHRTYLQDASFLVVISTSKQWHKRLTDALCDPKWPVYLGRKCCVPSRPVLECADPKETDHMKLLRGYPPAPHAQYPLAFETETQEDQREQTVYYTRPDRRKTGYRSFARRTVWRGMIEEESHGSDKN